MNENNVTGIGDLRTNRIGVNLSLGKGNKSQARPYVDLRTSSICTIKSDVTQLLQAQERLFTGYYTT